jgi:tetratricopeptide (TPR) repeat protein
MGKRTVHQIVAMTAVAALLMSWGANSAKAQRQETDNVVRFFQWKISQDPDDFINYDHLGGAYLQKARETGDPVYYGLSETSYKKALSLTRPSNPESAGSTVHLAALYFSEHRFKEATDLAESALALDPSLLSAYATLGDAQLETGNYDQAAISYAKLKVPKGSLPPRPGLAYLWESRQASYVYIDGRPQEAIDHMKAAIAEAREAGFPKENIAWSQFSLGELYYGIGDFTDAESAYQAALQTYPDYHRALAWLGQLRAAQGRYQEAAELYGKAIAVIPLPVYAAALGDIYVKMGKIDEAKKEYDLVDFIAKLSALNQQLFRRELATFYADHNVHLSEAVDLARAELALRHDVYTWDALGWAYLQHGDTTEAVGAISHALAKGTKDPLLFFHAGMIYARAGDTGKGRDFLKLALTINPHFHIRYADEANRKLALLDADPQSSGVLEEGGNAR